MSWSPALSLRTETCLNAAAGSHKSLALKRSQTCCTLRSQQAACRSHRKVTKSFRDSASSQSLLVAHSKSAHPVETSRIYIPRPFDSISSASHDDSPVTLTCGRTLPSLLPVYSEHDRASACLLEAEEALKLVNVRGKAKSYSQATPADARIHSRESYFLQSSIKLVMQPSDIGAAEVWSMARFPPVLASSRSTKAAASVPAGAPLSS